MVGKMVELKVVVLDVMMVAPLAESLVGSKVVWRVD